MILALSGASSGRCGEFEADETNRQYARRLDELEKIVASRTGRIASWPGSRCIQEVSEAEIRRVKASADGDVVVYGIWD